MNAAERVNKRLSEVWRAAPQMDFDDHTRLIFFSDCHRGDNSAADEFAPNQRLFVHALSHYQARGFHYVEVGDGDELMKNSNFELIRRAHMDVFRVMQQFHADGRLHMIFGNHDLVRRNPTVVARTLHQYVDEASGHTVPLFPGLHVYEGLRLHHTPSQRSLMAVHGHQGDLIDENFHKAGKFLVRHVWRRVQQVGIHHPGEWYTQWRSQGSQVGPTCDAPPRSFERRLASWALTNHLPLITGHSHRPIFAPSPGLPIFNCGSCVQPFQLSGLEITDGAISLVNWSVQQGAFVRKLVAGPMTLRTLTRGDAATSTSTIAQR